VKIVHVIGAMVAGGAERFVVSLLKRLKTDGTDVGLWALSNRRDKVGQDLTVELARTGIPCEAGPNLRVGWSTVRWYAHQLTVQHPAVVHLHTPNSELAHFLSGFVAPKALSRHGRVLIRTIHNTELPTSWIMRQAYKSNRASYSIACGEAVAAAYANRVAGAFMHISNGVEFSYPVKSRQSESIARQLLGLGEAGFHAIHIGRMSGATMQDSQKAHDILLHAWRRSGVGQRGGLLHLLGDGNLRDQLVCLADGDPSVRFHGVRNDIQTWLQAADCFVMASRFEGLPIAGIEAIGAGLPCIFTDIPPLRELSPPMVRWCAANDAKSLASQLVLMAGQHELPPIAETAKFRELYSINRTAQQYLEVYRRYGLAS
jgi:glycosyltransferase involved in cell wall biosynthesis